MTTDRTQHVIDAIDGALDDWSVGPDAMRWTPEPETAPPAASARWQPTLVGSSIEHRPGCGIVHEYLDRPPACQCGAVDRAARQLRLPTSALRVAPAGADPRDRQQWLDIGQLVDGVDFRPAPWQAAVFTEMFGSAFRVAAEAMSRTMGATTGSIERLLATLAEAYSVDAEEDEPDEDPRARALRLRRERGTGPARDLTMQRRPRHHRS